MHVTVLTTSYPRHDGDFAGAFVRDAVLHLRDAGADIDVVSPATFRDFGVAYGDGIAANLRARPARWALVPPFLASFAVAARRAARRADLVHAHWLPSGFAALATGRPYVLQAWGTDVELARRAPALFRPVVRRARVAIAPSTAIADALRALGARDVLVIGSGVDLPAQLGAPDEPPHVLFVGRLAAEKGIEELAAATRGLRRVVVGEGRLRELVPDAIGFVPPAELGRYYDRAAIVVCPSRREGYGVVAREAMAHGRPVVASAVGGLLDAVEHERTGLLVPPRDASALRAALERLLADPALRARLGAAARERAGERFTWAAATAATLAAYESAVSPGQRPTRR
ncbi:MAG TPA: glycosyltransferase [Gaiellaceae bacterium]|nr:glycosyltransferase [Gaiellaceae bacterium]